MNDDLRKKYMEDPYYQEYICPLDLSLMESRISKYAEEKNIILPIHKSLKVHVALRIKELSLRSSCRLLADICFDEKDSRHGLQMDGRDLKRWSAIVLGEIFTSKALYKGDYWHE